MNKISAIILTKNSEKMIPDCLRSLAWIDETLVIDDESKDRTVQVARKNGARVLKTVGGSFSDRRNYGAINAKGDWIFYIDSDERVTPGLKREVLKVTRSDNFGAYAIPRRNIIFGKEMKHCGLWPDYVLRLIKKEKFKGWRGELHEQPKVAGEIDHLKSPLLHLKHKNIGGVIEKTNEWSEIEARLMFDAHHPKMNVLRFFSAGFREFILRMIVQAAFLDGVEGVIYALYQVFSRLISYTKLWEMQLNGSK